MNSSPPQNLPYALNRTLSEILTRAIFKVCGWAHIHTSHEWCGDCNMAHGAFKTGPNLKYQACEFPYLFWSPSYTCTLHEMSSKMSVHSQCLSNGNNNDVVDTNERRTCGEWQVGPLFKNSAPYNWPNTPDKFLSKMGLPHNKKEIWPTRSSSNGPSERTQYLNRRFLEITGERIYRHFSYSYCDRIAPPDSWKTPALSPLPVYATRMAAACEKTTECSKWSNL